MKAVFCGVTKDGKTFEDTLYLRDRMAKGVIRDVFNAWKQQNEFNYGVRLANAKYVCLN